MRVVINITVHDDSDWRVIGAQSAEVKAQNIAMACIPWEKICAGLVGDAVFQAERELQTIQKEVNDE